MVFEIINLENLHNNIDELKLESDSKILESAFGNLLFSTGLKSV
jgi:hypothetical protein